MTSGAPRSLKVSGMTGIRPSFKQAGRIRLCTRRCYAVIMKLTRPLVLSLSTLFIFHQGLIRYECGFCAYLAGGGRVCRRPGDCGFCKPAGDDHDHAADAAWWVTLGQHYSS